MLELRTRVLQKEHISVASFSADVVHVINTQFGNSASTISELIALVSGRAEDMKPEERDRRTLARRIVKAIEPLIEDAACKEAELNGRPYAQQIREMDEALISRRVSLTEFEMPLLDSAEPKHSLGIASPVDADIEMGDSMVVVGDTTPSLTEPVLLEPSPSKKIGLKHESLLGEQALLSASTPPASTNGFRHDHHAEDITSMQTQHIEPPTPPMSLEGHVQTLPSQGGIPWYVAQFDPEGTTVFEERWTGPEVLRDMSEELSEMDEDELQGLGPGDDISDGANSTIVVDDGHFHGVDSVAKKAIRRIPKRGKSSSEWGTRSFRTRR